MLHSQNTLTNLQIAAFCSQMSMILRSGLSAAEGAAVLGADAPKEDQALYTKLLKSLENGDSLGTAMRSQGSFPDYACDMVELGSFSGNTDAVLSSLSDHYEREEEIASALKSAVTYPGVMICMMAAVIIVLITKVLPVFDQVFSQLGSGLLGFSRGLLRLGTWLERYAVFFVTLLFLTVIGIYLMGKTKKGRQSLQKLLYAFPPVRRLKQQIEVGRFADGLCIALSSGLSVEEGLQLSARLITDSELSQKANSCLKSYREGASFSDAIADSEIFPALQTRMLAVGCQAGAVETVLRRISEQNTRQSNEQISRLLGILEPALVALLSCIVGLILLSVMLPLLGIMSGIGL